MRLYDYGPSQNCFKVRLLAAHLGMALEVVPVSIFNGEGALPEFLAKNPMGTVPLLETDSGEYLPESNAILTFLAEGTPYLPCDSMPRAQVPNWHSFPLEAAARRVLLSGGQAAEAVSSPITNS